MKSGLVASALLLVLLALEPRAQQPVARLEGGTAASAAGVTLAPTNHPVLPRELARLWFAPEPGRSAGQTASVKNFAAAMKLADAGNHAKALPILSQPATQQGVLGEYAAYYAALIELRLGRPANARPMFQALQQRRPIGYLAEAAALGEAECAEALNDHDAAVEIYERLAKTKTTAPDELLMRLAGAAKTAREFTKAAEAFARAYYEFPLSPVAPLARAELDALPNFQRIAPGNQRYKLELGRAERLFGARKYVEAQDAFEALASSASGDDRELINLRIAEADYFLKRYRQARDGVRPHIERASRQGEALYFYAASLRELGATAEYQQTVRRIVDEFPTQSWAEEALNSLATYYIVRDQDDEADAVLRELYAKYPRGSYSERAAWKVGWRSYRAGRYAETIHYFDRAAADLARSDYRPAWLYWSGRAHDHLKQRSLADERYMLAAADYLNSYYGRLAAGRLEGRRPEPRVVGDTPTSVLPPPPNEQLIRTLLSVERYNEALNELRYAQRAWGDSPAIQATISWTYKQQGRTLTGAEQFTLLRGSITLMRRAYPQFMAAGGEDLPREVLTMIFPIAYWDLIRKYTAQNGLDPYLVAALVAQESTFVPDIRSHANAVGLMQLLPSTARQLARRLNLRYSSRLLTTPEPNIRMGTTYFAEKIREFGGVHLALASYNAGERAVRRWLDERPGLTDREEFIDDIPYPETQNYVKRILGTAEDYRRLYGS